MCPIFRKKKKNKNKPVPKIKSCGEKKKKKTPGGSERASNLQGHPHVKVKVKTWTWNSKVLAFDTNIKLPFHSFLKHCALCCASQRIYGATHVSRNDHIVNVLLHLISKKTTTQQGFPKDSRWAVVLNYSPYHTTGKEDPGPSDAGPTPRSTRNRRYGLACPPGGSEQRQVMGKAEGFCCLSPYKKTS